MISIVKRDILRCIDNPKLRVLSYTIYSCSLRYQTLDKEGFHGDCRYSLHNDL